VFYYRFPNQPSGTITGFVKKEYLHVKGNGTATLLELIQEHPRARFRLEEMKSKHIANLNNIIPAGEVFILSQALNLSRGARLVSLEHEKDERLLKIFDDLSHYSGNFYFGRYDIKCASIEDLKNGKNFKILEFNGSGAEPHHVYGNGNTLIRAIAILLYHWHILYKISLANHKRGVPYWSFRRGYDHLKQARQYFRILKQLDIDSPVLEPDKVVTQSYFVPEMKVMTNT
jgi:hypothetical protein